MYIWSATPKYVWWVCLHWMEWSIVYEKVLWFLIWTHALHLVHIWKFIDMARNAHDLWYHAHALANKNWHLGTKFSMHNWTYTNSMVFSIWFVSLLFFFFFFHMDSVAICIQSHSFVQMWNVNVMELWSINTNTIHRQIYRKHGYTWQKRKLYMERRAISLFRTKIKCHDGWMPSHVVTILFNWFVCRLFTRDDFAYLYVCIYAVNVHGSQ